MFLIQEFEHLKIQLQDVISTTDNFGPGKLIGRGGFGQVYKGELSHPEGPRTVAFKRLDRRLGQGNTEFWKEIMMLSKLKHENLISLLHFCSDGDERILVYEYASRGSLDRYLSDVSLSWIQRLNICIQSARAINYLHDPRKTQQRVLHRDIKSSNILLDENWDAKVSDFGLSKFAPANQPQTYVISNGVGTIGYCDPLYYETGLLSKETDVYSFGVVLFEVMCGKLCCEYRNNQRYVLVRTWKECFVEKRLDDIIFPALKKEMVIDSLLTFSTIAYRCLNGDHKERPAMVEIINELELAFKQQVSAGSNIQQGEPSGAYQNQNRPQQPSISPLDTVGDSCKKTSLKLCFLANVPNILYTGMRIVSVDNNVMKVVLFDVVSNQIVSSGPFSSLKVEIVPLDGDFSADGKEGRSDNDFNTNVLYARDGILPLIKGDTVVTLESGVADLRELRISHFSSWMSSRKFMIGARVKDTLSGVRVQEVTSQAFIVKDRRGRLYKKHYPPSLGDEIWRLKKITKDGVFHERLVSHNISTVKDFLQMYITNQSLLRELLGTSSDNTWEVLTKHANTCVLDDQRYLYKCGADGMELLLNSVLQVVGATFDGQTHLTLDKLSEDQIIMVEASKQQLYRDLDGRVPMDDPSITGVLVSMQMSSLHLV